MVSISTPCQSLVAPGGDALAAPISHGYRSIISTPIMDERHRLGAPGSAPAFWTKSNGTTRRPTEGSM